MNLRKHKPTIQLLAAIALIALGCGLLIAGFILPPRAKSTTPYLWLSAKFSLSPGHCLASTTITNTRGQKTATKT